MRDEAPVCLVTWDESTSDNAALRAIDAVISARLVLGTAWPRVWLGSGARAYAQELEVIAAEVAAAEDRLRAAHTLVVAAEREREYHLARGLAG